MKKSALIFPLLLLVPFVSCGKSGIKQTRQNSQLQEAWNPSNAPLRMDSNYIANFDRLPKSGRTSFTPWSDSYWPSNEGGISKRWFAANPQNFSYQPPSQSAAQSMSPNQLAELSPAEKYDIYMGRFDYPTVRSERARTSPGLASWEGICHGWAPAAYLYNEPDAVTVMGPSGISIPFGASDVKALLSYTQALLNDSPVRGLGLRCDVSDLNTPECRDTNAGAFHVVLANQIGLRKQSFLADVNRNYQVWNQPVSGFTSQVRGYQPPSPGAAPSTVREAIVETNMIYTVETDAAWRAKQYEANSKNYLYRLELNANNDIIGGEWMTNERPDFLWQQGRPRLVGYFAGVTQIYAASTRSATLPTDGMPAIPSTPPTGGNGAPPLPVDPNGTDPNSLPVGILGALECPAPYALVSVGSAGGRVCANDIEVYGPFTAAMTARCAQWGGGNACNNAQWNREIALSARGNGLCPIGSFFDTVSHYCIEGNSALGPFPKALVSKCMSSGAGESCKLLRWDRNFVLSMLQ